MLRRSAPLVERGKITGLASALALFLLAFDGIAQSMPAELIIKFTDTSEPGRAVNAAASASRVPGQDPDLLRLAAQLSDDMRAPLVPIQVTSGRELVVNLDRDQFAANLVAQLSVAQDILQVTTRPSEAAIAAISPLVLQVNYASPAATQSEIQDRLDHLQTTIGDLPFAQLEVITPSTVDLIVNLALVMTNIVDNLRLDSEVAYVQPNFRVQHHDDNSGLKLD